MKNSNREERQFFDLVYSPDDNGWYGDVCLLNGKSIYTTKIYPTKGQAESDLLKNYPHAELLQTII